ncbi:MAG TPA: hypothetical protein DD649_02555 [Providencia sp.]|uniref:hypothetical protein n=1 Tax=Providencia sp. TaxID=589 RepID=UPI000E86AFC1|nr:hypothetical protein [Providencia sp.]HBO21761.1 hypothetical protein [Providencia sp.]
MGLNLILVIFRATGVLAALARSSHVVIYAPRVSLVGRLPVTRTISSHVVIYAPRVSLVGRIATARTI